MGSPRQDWLDKTDDYPKKIIYGTWIKNKVAFVAASSKGLGKAVALELSREGAKVVINGRYKESLEKKTKQGDRTTKPIKKY